MQQVTQNIRNGKLSIVDLPEPVARPGQLLIANGASVISAGTERMVMELASKSLLGKARERPDHVRRVLEKLRSEGLFNTLRQVRAKLDEPMTLGYSSAGTVLACGAGIQQFKPGDRVASTGAHAGVVSVPRLLCARVPDGVDIEHAAFTAIGAIALQGVRLARPGLDETAFVIGLGLIGQISVALLRAAGCRVLATDPDEGKCRLATRMGAELSEPSLSPRRVSDRTAGLGADVVVITASTPSNQPIELAADTVRQKGKVVAVGAVGLGLPRRPFYFKEAEFVVSCSCGPGRYDAEYEMRGHDYPSAYVRWSEQRNFQAVLALMSTGRLDIAPLISHRFEISEAESAYALIRQPEQPYLGVVLRYPDIDHQPPSRSVRLRANPAPGQIGLGCLGAGSFARSVLLPLVARERRLRPLALCAPGGLSAQQSGQRQGFESVTTDETEVLSNPDVGAVFVITRHDQHARQVTGAIRAGKHVFVEKPLALTVDELGEIETALAAHGDTPPLLLVGFNRRFSPAAVQARKVFAELQVPLTVSVRFNPGSVPAHHWVQDEATGGGRIIGEACHGIDLATSLCGSPPVRVFAESVGGDAAGGITDDQVFITLRHANGSVSSVAYLSGGDRAYPRERVEIIGAGRVAVIDNFVRLETCVDGRRSAARLGQQDKGHHAEVKAFVRTLVDGGEAPIPWSELRAVSLASILAVRSLREGLPFDF